MFSSRSSYHFPIYTLFDDFSLVNWFDNCWFSVFIYIFLQPDIRFRTIRINGIPINESNICNQLVRWSSKAFNSIFPKFLQLFVFKSYNVVICSDISNNNLGNQIPYQLPPNVKRLYVFLFGFSFFSVLNSRLLKCFLKNYLHNHSDHLPRIAVTLLVMVLPVSYLIPFHK